MNPIRDKKAPWATETTKRKAETDAQKSRNGLRKGTVKLSASGHKKQTKPGPVRAASVNNINASRASQVNIPCEYAQQSLDNMAEKVKGVLCLRDAKFAGLKSSDGRKGTPTVEEREAVKQLNKIQIQLEKWLNAPEGKHFHEADFDTIKLDICKAECQIRKALMSIERGSESAVKVAELAVMAEQDRHRAVDVIDHFCRVRRFVEQWASKKTLDDSKGIAIIQTIGLFRDNAWDYAQNTLEIYNNAVKDHGDSEDPYIHESLEMMRTIADETKIMYNSVLAIKLELEGIVSKHTKIDFEEASQLENEHHRNKVFPSVPGLLMSIRLMFTKPGY